METKNTNASKTKEAKNPFHKAYFDIPQPKKKRVKVRNKIIKATGTNVHTFYYWINDITEVPFLAKPIISKIFGIPQSELFPEDD